MAYLISNAETVEREAGFNFRDVMLVPFILMDAPRTAAPLILETAETSWLLIREQEKGNVGRKGVSHLPVAYYRPYFTFDTIGMTTRPPLTLGLAIKNLTADQELLVDDDLPYGLYEDMRLIFDDIKVKRRDVSYIDEVTVYSVPREKVIERFAKPYSLAVEAARALIEKSEGKGKLSNHLSGERADRRFLNLDLLMEISGLEAIWITSPMNFQEVSGMAKDPKDIGAIYTKTGDAVYIVTTREIQGDSNELKQIGRFIATREALASILARGQTVGFEDGHLDISGFEELDHCGVRLRGITQILRFWREERVDIDLPYYIIAAQASRYAIDGALGFARKQIEAGASLTERTVEERYLELLQEFRERNHLPVNIATYFTNLHSGIRTVYPSRPVDFPLDSGIKTVKIDAGVFIVDGEGLIHGSSDIGGTLALTAEGMEIYNLIEEIILNDIIPSIRPGMICESIYERGVSVLEHRLEGRAKELGMLPGDISLAETYRRDIGHVMGKQESMTISFRKGNKYIIKEGQVGCVEVHWPYSGHGIVAEDMFFVTGDGAVTISR